MKSIINTTLSMILGGLIMGLSAAGAAEEKAPAVTLKGTATCAKCDLKVKDECASVLQVKDGDKTVTYYLDGLADSEWHKKICMGAKSATLTGTVSEKDGMKMLKVTKVDKLGK